MRRVAAVERLHGAEDGRRRIPRGSKVDLVRVVGHGVGRPDRLVVEAAELTGALREREPRVHLLIVAVVGAVLRQ